MSNSDKSDCQKFGICRLFEYGVFESECNPPCYGEDAKELPRPTLDEVRQASKDNNSK
ncbi:hypothetical protein IQ247_18115 [Plectonema cf. radiosum LEGE 06105]|uniref:Uncharacterized protein n=1 Tax=Plectonema cf. radiosum LEGE 06105 TaxID=945769 RepID=A0A8J7F3Z5_9CYAN|nr:hypothetical protein [Plectonema radiosum]MBE9214560.1 hypothetical protein [Plectonema cf. radiosum LEGE 06105]